MALVFRLNALSASDALAEQAQAVHLQLQDAQRNFGDAKKTCSLATVDYARKCVNPYELLSHVDSYDVTMHKNRAFYKILEIVALFPTLYPCLTNNRTLHLCEAPGNFIDGVSFLAKQTNDWHASSLRGPKNITFYSHHLEAKKTNGHARVIFGEDGTGNITHAENSERLICENGVHRATLVTGDGGFQLDDQEYEEQEERSHQLWAAELYTALRALAPGGALVLKIFHGAHEITHALMALLLPLFGAVHLVKLRTSRICNGECYVVAEGFNKNHSSFVATMEMLKTVAFKGTTEHLVRTPLQSLYQAFIAMAQQQIAACTDCVALAYYLQAIGIVSLNDVRQHSTQLYANETYVAAAQTLLDEIYPVLNI